MRAREFISESKLQDAHDYLDLVSASLPQAFVIPELKNNDFYDLYRFGVAIADVRGTSGDDHISNGFKPDFRPESSWGENQIVVSYDTNLEKVIDAALKKVNKKGKIQIASNNSSEVPDTTKTSPLKPFKGYKR
jgi:hypothetical protein